MNKFYYHPQGWDNNGNNRPLCDDPGWVIIQGNAYEDAILQLPREAQAKINKWHKEMFEDDDLTLSQALAGDCLWGAGFILANESDWEDLSYEDQEG
jgi:hypothetical protein